jgi:hypothetical protein
VKWTRLSCHDFADNRARLQLFALAYNLRNSLRRLALPASVAHWSRTTLREKLIKIGAKVVRTSRYVVFQMAEVAVPRHLFRSFSTTPPHGGVVWFTGGPFRPSRRGGQKPRRIPAVWRFGNLRRCALGSRAFQSQPVRTPGVSSWVRRETLELSASRVDGVLGSTVAAGVMCGDAVVVYFFPPAGAAGIGDFAASSLACHSAALASWPFPGSALSQAV